MERNSLVCSENGADSPGGVDNGLEMRPMGPSSAEDLPRTPRTPPPISLAPLLVQATAPGEEDAAVHTPHSERPPGRPPTPDFPGAPPSSPMQVTAPGGGFGDNSETIQSEGVRNLVQELQQMSHAQRQLQALRQQQLLEEQRQQLDAQLPSGGPLSASGQQLYLAAQSEGWPGLQAAPPDGGYGWVVVLSCFLCMVVVDGISFGFGILLSPIQETFEAGKASVSLAGALLTGFYLLVGPLTSALCSRFSYRKVTIFGSVLSTVAMIGASYAQELPLFIFLYGVLGGTGFGVIYITCFSVVGAWFQRKRALATGTVVCGTGVGLAIIGMVGPLLLRAYSWRGALVVFACLVLQGCVCGAAFRPAELHQRILRADEARRARKEAKRKEREAEEEKNRANAHAQNGVDRGAKSNGAASERPSGDSASDRKNRRRRKMHAHRCSIMQKIIEDKERQRTVSSGSLNGCIITQDNQLIQPPDDYSESPRLSQNTLNRIVDSMRRRGLPGSDSRSRSRQNSIRLAKEMPMMVANYVNQSNQQQQQQSTSSKSNDVNKEATGQTLVVKGTHGGSSLPSSRPPSTAGSRHNSAASLFHSVDRESAGVIGGPSATASSSTARVKGDLELQRPLLLQLDSVTGTATSSGAATPSIAASSATPAPTALIGRRMSARRSPSGSLHCSGSFAQLPPALGPVSGGGVRTSSLLASPTSDSRLPSRQNSFLVQGVPHPAAVGGYTIDSVQAEELAYLEQPGVTSRRDLPCCSGVVVDSCWQMLTPSILMSPTFLLLTVSSMFTMFGFLIPNMLLVDYATSLAMPADKAAHLITYLGVANTFGRICTVFYITNVLNKERPLLRSLTLNNFTLVLSGVITVLLPFSGLLFKGQLYSVFVAYSVIYGFSIAVFVSMRGFIVDEMLGAESLTNAFGYLLLFQGMAVVAGPPIFGWLVDFFGGYREAFCLGGSAVLLSGLLLLPLRRLATWEKQRNTLAQIEDFEVASAATGEPGAYTPVGGYEAVASSATNFYGSANSCAAWSAAPQPPPTPV